MINNYNFCAQFSVNRKLMQHINRLHCVIISLTKELYTYEHLIVQLNEKSSCTHVNTSLVVLKQLLN